jgi:mannose-6-phosphate isomerase
VTPQTAAAHGRALGLLLVEPAVKHYPWGGRRFISDLLGIANPDNTPFAEAWIGTHPLGPTTVAAGQERLTLARLVEGKPAMLLGERTTLRFEGELPFLFKVLDAEGMLSIQAHPSIAQAQEGFAREDAQGIGLDAPGRNYRDRNHKPEIQVALAESWMLHGFRAVEEIEEAMGEVPEIGAAMPDFSRRLSSAGWDPQARRDVLRHLYRALMTMPQERVDSLLDPLIARLEAGPCPAKDSPDYWALAAARDFTLPGGHRDRGIFSIYLMNLLHLRPGQGTFQPPGTLHAYLQCTAIELMASSDNVLRGGLTPKHVDAGELLRTVSFDSGRPPILEGRQVSAAERVYEAPVEDFLLSRIELAGGAVCGGGASGGPECLLVIEGAARARWASGTQELPRGSAVFAPAGVPYSLEAVDAARPAIVFKAGVPLPSER